LQRYRQTAEILELRGGCPECANEQAIAPPSALPSIQRCPACGAFLKLEEIAA
jgi:ribosomal protein S27E